MPSSAHNSPSPGASASTPKRLLICHVNENSSARKRQRLSSDASDLLIEASEMEAVGSLPDNAITIDDEEIMAAYSSDFDLGLSSDPAQQLLWLCNRLDDHTCYVEVEHIDKVVEWLRRHLHATISTSSATRLEKYLYDERFFNNLASFALKLLEHDDCFDPEPNTPVPNKDIIALLITFYHCFADLALRLLRLMPDAIEGTVTRRDSAHTSSTTSLQLPFNSYLILMGRVLARDTRLTWWLRTEYNLASDLLVREIAGSFRADETLLTSLNLVLQVLLSQPGRIQNVWWGVSGILSTISSTARAEPGAGVFLRRADTRKQIEQTFSTVRQLVIPEIIKKHPRALPPGFHNKLVEDMAALLERFILECSCDEAMHIYRACIQTDFDFLFPYPAPSSADLSQLSQEDRTITAELFKDAWLLAVLKEFISADIMEIRTNGVVMMRTLLEKAWKRHSESDLRTDHPVLRYLARFLHQNEIAEYVLGPESHASLVKESRSIIAFLAVTHNWTERHTHTLWQACTSSAEDEFNKAACEALVEATQFLSLDHIFDLASRYSDTPPSSLGTYLTSFLPLLFARAKAQPDFLLNEDTMLRPAQIAFAILTQIPDDQVQEPSDVRNAARAELTTLRLDFYGTNHRKAIYDLCISEIMDQTAHVTTAFEILSIFTSFQLPHTEAQLLLHLLPVERVILDLTELIERSRSDDISSSASLQRCVSARVEYIILLIGLRPEPLTPKDERMLWSYAVGSAALNNEMRESSLDLILSAQRRSINQKPVWDLVSRCFHEFVPDMSMEHVTRRLVGHMEFIIKGDIKSLHNLSYERLLDNPLWQKLVQIGVATQVQTIERAAAMSVCNLLFTYPQNVNVDFGSILQFHADFVRRQIGYLAASSGDCAVDEAVRNDRTSRGFSFLDTVLRQSGEHPVFYYSQPSKVRLEPDPGQEELLTLKLYVHGPWSQPKHLEMEVTSNTKVAAISSALQAYTGAKAHDMARNGKSLEYEEIAEKEIGQTALLTASHVYIRPRYTFQDDFGMIFKPANPITQAVLDDYDMLEQFLDRDDSIAKQAYDLLTKLPAPEIARRHVMDQGVSTATLFPPAREFRTLYSIHVLHQHLRESNQLGVADRDFILQGARRLAEMISSDCSWSPNVLYASVTALIGFTQERPRESPPPPYFDAPETLAFCLLSILKSTVQQRSTIPGEFETNAILLQTLYAAVLQLLRTEENLWTKVCDSPEFREVHKLLILHRDVRLSKVVADMIDGFARENAANIPCEIIDMLIELIPTAIQLGPISEALFILLEKLVRQGQSWMLDERRIRSYFGMFTQILWRYRHAELPDVGLPDQALRGLLLLIHTTVILLRSFKRPLLLDHVAADIFDRLLFPDILSVNDTLMLAEEAQRTSTVILLEPPGDVFKEPGDQNNADDTPALGVAPPHPAFSPLISTETRQICFEIVRKLCETKHYFHALICRISQTVQYIPRNGQKYLRGTLVRPPAMCAGLRNLGMTCYMNSLLQQIYTNLRLREFILNVPITDPTKQTVLFVVQGLFAELQTYSRPSIETLPLAKQLNISVDTQEDVHGFYTILLGYLEQNILDSTARTEFTRMYSGKLLTQVRGSCGHVSSRIEAFSDLSITVQNKASLEASLSEFVQGEPMRGANRYKCMSCDPDNGGKLVDAMRRTCLDEVPDNLTLCLKRFTFDMMGQEQKNNDMFHFPQEIDMARFERKHLENPDEVIAPDVFKLVGVIVHAGILSFGHYWSYVRLRSPDSRERWVRLEDHMARGAAGFNEVIQESLGGAKSTHSAYVLFYERQTSYERATELASRLPVNTELECVVPPRVTLPRDLERQLHAYNHELYRIEHIHDPNFHSFVTALMKDMQEHPNDDDGNSGSNDSSLDADPCESEPMEQRSTLMCDPLIPDTADLAAAYLLHVLMADAGSAKLKDFITALVPQMTAYPQLTYRFLNSLTEDAHFTTQRYQLGDGEARQAINDLLNRALYEVKIHLPDMYADMFEAVIASHADLMETGRIDAIHSKWHDYFLFALRLAELGKPEMAAVHRRGYFEWAVEVLSLPQWKPQRWDHVPLCDERRRERADKSPLFSFLDAMFGLEVAGMSSTERRQVLNHCNDGVRSLFVKVGTKRDTVVPWISTAMNQMIAWDCWQSCASAKLIATLLATQNRDIIEFVQDALVASFREDFQPETVFAIVLHYCKMIGESDDTARVFRVLIEEVLQFNINLQKSTLTFLGAAFTWVPEAVTSTIDVWAVEWLKPSIQRPASTDKFLKTYLFDARPIGDVNERPIGQSIEVARVKMVRYLLAHCRPLLITAYRRGEDRGGWNHMVNVVQEGVSWAHKLQHQVEKVLEAADLVGEEHVMGELFMMEVSEIRDAEMRSTKMLQDVSRWEASSPIDDDDDEEDDEVEDLSDFETNSAE